MTTPHLRSFSDEALHSHTLTAAANEKAATLVLLEHLAEVDRRRLYAARGYSSLWEFVHKALGFSEAQASDRVAAVRVITRVPEVKAELQAGKLSLTSTAKLGTHMRRERLKPEETAALLPLVSGKPSREVERVLVQHSTEPPRVDRARAVTPELTRLTLDVDAEFLALVDRMKELRGNPAITFQEVFKVAMQEYVKRREPKKSASNGKSLKAQKPASSEAPEISTDSLFSSNSVSQSVPESSAAEQKLRAPAQPIASGIRVGRTFAPALDSTPRSRYISKSVKYTVRLRAGDRCEFSDPESGRRCESRVGLQFDHFPVPFAMGGSNDVSALRITCQGHNAYAAIQEYGEAKMRPYLNRE